MDAAIQMAGNMSRGTAQSYEISLFEAFWHFPGEAQFAVVALLVFCGGGGGASFLCCCCGGVGAATASFLCCWGGGGDGVL